ncbi:hypothetical protein M758_8G071600 [Ceratodon purpureus]|nr:hypothetical protein M758_8G071600 [Ceratodon purpureus]
MAMSLGLEKLSFVCFEARGDGRLVSVCKERFGAGVLVGGIGQNRRCFGEFVGGRVSREGVVLKSLGGVGGRASRVGRLVSESLPVADEHREVEGEVGGLNPKGEDSGDGDEEPTASPAPWMSEEEGKAVVSEVILNGDDLRVIEYPAKEDVQPEDTHPLNSLADSFLNKINGDGDGRGFSLTDVGGVWKTGEDAGELEVPELSISGFDVKEGVSPLAQWTSTELTMQHTQLARIVTDVYYMQFAFAFFGGVRVVEALLSVYSTSPPDFGKFKELLNALDPFTISWLANNVREPLSTLMEADPMDLEKVVSLKSNVWTAVHAFYERQWKVMATLALARSLSLIASHEPTAKAVTDKVQWLWNALMALPVF